MKNLSPAQIVEKLDQYIIGQNDAKKAVAVAIRNRWRRQQLDPDFAKEVSPKNIVMIGPTGVGKTEIARRIATLTGAPFIKIEATKFTEVGYHGRDVESMIRDLLDQSMNLVREEAATEVQEKAEQAVEEELLNLLLPDSSYQPYDPMSYDQVQDDTDNPSGWVSADDSVQRMQQTRDKLRQQLKEGKLDDREVEISTSSKSVPVAMFSNMGMDQMDPDMAKMFESLIPDQTKDRKMTIAQARKVLQAEETDKLIDREKIAEAAIERVESSGIVFLDEIDKIASPSEGGNGRNQDVSRQGVQRDLLPIVEGTAVTTRHGTVHTDHILFIAAGAFHISSIGDLMPELQGRFPIRVELQALTKGDFIRILQEPSNALTKQHAALLGTEGLQVSFEDEAIELMAEIAAQANQTMENIGARRLMTITEKLFEEISFDAPEMAEAGDTIVKVTKAMVEEKLSPVIESEDLSKFVL